MGDHHHPSLQPWPVALEARSPLAMGARLWSQHDVLYVTVVVKASFAIVPDGAAALVAPEPLLEHDAATAMGVVTAATEVAPWFGHPEVLLSGDAWAPRGTTKTRVKVRLAVSRQGKPLFDKKLFVYGPSRQDGTIAPFARIPMGWDRAFGGPASFDNPTGCPVPGVLDPMNPGRPAGFGPIPPGWPARTARLSGADVHALVQRIVALPDDFDGLFFQAAAADQWVEALYGDEEIRFDGMNPDARVVRTRLPSARLTVTVREMTALGLTAGDELEVRLDTLRIDADAQRCFLIWRGSFPVPSERLAASLHATASLELAGAALSEAVADRLAVTGNVAPERSPTLPFARGAHTARIRDGEVPIVPGAPWLTTAADLVPPVTDRCVETLPVDAPVASLETTIDQAPAFPSPSLPAAPSPPAARAPVPAPAMDPSKPAKRKTAMTVDLSDEPPPAAAVPAPFPLAAAPPLDTPRRAQRTSVGEEDDEGLPIATYALIRAEIWEGREPPARVLARHGFDEATWLRHEQRQQEALRREALAGESNLTRALAAAIRAARAQLGGGEEQADTIEEYVRLRTALDRAVDRSSALRRLGLSAAEWQRIDRRWRRRALADGAVARDLRARLSAAARARTA